MCAVGEGLQNDPTFVGHLIEALGGVPIRMMSQAAARRNVTVVIRATDLPTALKRVHDRFFAPTRLAEAASEASVRGGG